MLLVSTNPLYQPYSVPVTEVLEIWKFVNYISSELPSADDKAQNILNNAVMNIEKEMSVIKNSLRKN